MGAQFSSEKNLPEWLSACANRDAQYYKHIRCMLDPSTKMTCLKTAISDLPYETRREIMSDTTDVVQSGVSGSVFRTNRGTVIKFPVRPNAESNAALMAEEFMLKILHCDHVVMRFQEKYPLLGTPPDMMLVRPKGLLQTKLAGRPAVGMEMERLDLTLKDCLRTETDALVIKDIFVQLLAGMHALWESRGFMHRDLHASNVMLRRLPNPESPSVSLKEKSSAVLNLRRKYTVRIIDTGISCFQAGGKPIELPTPYKGYTGKKDQCVSPSFDCEYLLMHLVSAGLEERIPPELQSRVQSLKKLVEHTWGTGMVEVASEHHKTIALLNVDNPKFSALALLGCFFQVV